MIGVFRTNVKSCASAEQIIFNLNRIYPGSSISFDLEDCDSVLRIAGDHDEEKITSTLIEYGFTCEVME